MNKYNIIYNENLIYGIIVVIYLGTGCFPSVVSRCFGESELEKPLDSALKNDVESSRSNTRELFLLLCCFTGLMGSYLTWGLLQEKVMTQVFNY